MKIIYNDNDSIMELQAETDDDTYLIDFIDFIGSPRYIRSRGIKKSSGKKFLTLYTTDFTVLREGL